jgi:uncharacterized protein (TIGR02271 family)
MSGRDDPFDIPLHEDDVRVMRHQIQRGDDSSEIPAGAFQDIEIEIPLRGEEVTIRTRPVVREEIVVSKVLRERIRPTTETLRREELHIDHDAIDDERLDVTLERNRRGQGR